MISLQCFFRLTTVFVLTIISGSANAYLIGAYKGDLGKSKIRVEFLTDHDIIFGRYYYEKQALDIRLKGKILSANKYLLNEDDLEAKHNKDTIDIGGMLIDYLENFIAGAEWTIDLKPNNQVLGTWIDNKSQKHLPITLTRISEAIVKLDGTPEKTFDEYENFRFFAPLKEGDIKTTDDNKVTYKYLTDERTGISYPRIIKAAPLVDTKSINTALEKKQRNDILNYYNCLNSIIKKDKNWEQSSADIQFLNSKILSLSIERTTFCGGPHPDNYVEYANFSLESGHKFNFNSIFNAPLENSQIQKNLKQVALEESHKTQSKDREEGEQCDDFYNDDTPFNLAFSPNGLLFMLDAPHVAAAVCNIPLTINYNKIKNILNNENLDNTLRDE